MNKQKLMLGLAVALVVVGLSTAAVVEYLSNSVTTNVSVTSPLLLSPSSSTDLTVYGGETVQLNYTVQNFANVAITGTFELYVSNPSGMTCIDFTEVKSDGVSIYGSCSVLDANTVFFTGSKTYSAQSTVTTQDEMTFATGAIGSYTVQAQVFA